MSKLSTVSTVMDDQGRIRRKKVKQDTAANIKNWKIKKMPGSQMRYLTHDCNAVVQRHNLSTPCFGDEDKWYCWKCDLQAPEEMAFVADLANCWNFEEMRDDQD